MTTNVEPEEAEAINELVQEQSSESTPAAVVQRDFTKPHRFSEGSLGSFRRSLTLGLPDLDRELRARFKRSLRTEALEVEEVTAAGLFDDLGDPFTLGSFLIAGQPAWIQWDNRAAVGAIELLLGSEGDPEPRALSGIECHLLADIFGAVVNSVAQALKVEASDLSIAKTAEDIPSWQDAGSEAESHRLAVTIQLEGIGEGSSFHLYLPGVHSGSVALDSEEDARSVPEHLNEICVEVGAYLGSSDVPLNDLLKLEIGDVIPLETLLSDPLQLRVEGHACGTVEMGTRNGNRAVRIIEITSRLDDIT